VTIPHALIARLFAALRAVRAIVYAVIHPVDFTLEESTALIGRLDEIDRRLAAAAHDPLTHT
jgi:hypothetical protein